MEKCPSGFLKSWDNDCVWFMDWKPEFFVCLESLFPEKQLPDTPEKCKELMELCKVHHIHPVVRIKNGRDDFRDLLDNCIWSVFTEEGSPEAAVGPGVYGITQVRRTLPEKH